MEKVLLLLVSLAVNIWPLVTGSYCGAKKQDVMYAKIPDYHSLLSLDEFDSFIVDKRMGEMYFALERPPIFMPDMNYKSSITKIPASSKYMQSTSGESTIANSQCVRENATLTPMYGLDKTLFFRGDGTSTVQAMWSSCPSKYIWNMRCENFVYGKRKCLLSETYFGVYIHDDMNDAPMDDIVQDLCRATGIRFGSQNFKWFFTFGENTVC
ncbi:uncharacterized protein LOC123537594 [Mercenaria mercenaria]|uniref:uncharacterized protein LOC123537594 n=1 Tax=Mercenaria mercenaria TaxID=6596 RepID=UPI001E1D700F|nr:uncharacterized protein LOC123537594 [Mercenaria mercenaria]